MADSKYQSNPDTVVQVVQVEYDESESARKSALVWSLLSIMCGGICCACISIPAFISSLDRGKPISTYMSSRRKAIIAFIIFIILFALSIIFQTIAETIKVLSALNRNETIYWQGP